MTTDTARLAIAWADNAIATMCAVPDMADWLVANGAQLHQLERCSADKRKQLQAAVHKRWDEIEARREVIRQGAGG